MLFSNPRTNSYMTGNYSNNQNVSMPIYFTKLHPNKKLQEENPKKEATYYRDNKTITEPSQTIQKPPENKPKKMKWGQPIWFLFHTLAEKIKDEEFDSLRVEFLNIIYTICANLPCPDCANHATQYMNGINYQTIQTKQQLIDILYTFHNSVNQRKMFPIFPYSELREKYSKANTLKIIQNFMVHFQDKHYSIRMIANDFHRNILVNRLITWFNANISKFNP